MTGAANAGVVFANRQDSSAEKIKLAVAKIGVGEKARVTVIRRDGTKLSGYISQARDTDFIVTEKKTNNNVTVLYAEAAKVKKSGLSKAAKIGIGIGIGAAVYVIVVAIITKGFQPTGN